MTGDDIPIGWTLISDRHLNALVEGFAEVMATSRGESTQSIHTIVEYVLQEISESPDMIQGFNTCLKKS